MSTHNPYEFRVRGRRLHADEAPQVSQAGLPPRTLTSEALFEGLHEIGIHHAGALYRLKITRQGKLILNK